MAGVQALYADEAEPIGEVGFEGCVSWGGGARSREEAGVEGVLVGV